MSKRLTWPMKINCGFLHERTVICSLLFLLVVFTFDCFFQRLPLSGYGLIFISIILITLTTCSTCHSIKWVITSSKPLYFCLTQKSQNEKWAKLLLKWEDKLFRWLLGTLEKGVYPFKYPTTLNEQVRLMLKDIEKDFVKTWYSEVSQNPSFLFESHSILEEFFIKIVRKFKTCNYKNLLSRLLKLYLNSLQEYKKSVKKYSRIKSETDAFSKVELSDVCRYFHPGTQNDQILNYFLKKVTKVILKEFSPYEFSNSLECKILSGIIGRKIVRKLLITLEDPTWINLKLIYLLNCQRHEKLLRGGIYVAREKGCVSEDTEFRFEKNIARGKRYTVSNLFDTSRNFFERNDLNAENTSNVSEKSDESQRQSIEKGSLTLSLPDDKAEENKGNISSVLSGLISSTAGPLLPDNISVHYKALNKMWQSPVAEVKDFSESITSSFRKVFANGTKEKKSFGRSKSTESLAVPGEPALKARDISIGEELCETARFGSPEFSKPPPPPPPPPPTKVTKKLTKTQSFDSDSITLERLEEEKPTEMEKSSSPEYQRDVSPVYEEPEDFATTIAKLRSLLQQRESSSTLSDKSNLSIDSQTADRSQSSNKSQSLEGDPFDTQLACDLPLDGRIFVNVMILKGELLAESESPHVVYTIQYDGIYMLKNDQNAEPQFVLQTTVVKRRFQDFLQLQMKLEENSEYKAILKSFKGPSKWLSLSSSGKAEESLSRKTMLENFLRQICSKVEFSHAPELHEFLAYGQTGNDSLVKKDSEPYLQRIDKLLSNKFTGMFNSIKTALPSFDFDSSPAFIATNEVVKGVQEQTLLQGFLNFGNKSDCFELNLNFIPKEQTGDSLIDDIRHFLSQKSDCIEDAVDVLNSSDWLTDQRECRFVSAEDTCVWENYKDFVVDDELEALDSLLPIYSVLIDIVSELLEDSESWTVKEPVIRLIKVASGHWESRLEQEMRTWDWDRIAGNAVRLLRTSVFYSAPREVSKITAEETKTVLKEVILDLVPDWFSEFVKPEGFRSAVSLFVDSFQHLRLNRDLLLRLLDVVLVHLLSCHHLISRSLDGDKPKLTSETEAVA